MQYCGIKVLYKYFYTVVYINIYQDGVLVGYEDFDGKKRYVLPDHEESAHIVLNESGDVIEENLFSPFAEPLAGVIENKFSYEAKEYDSLVKDYDFHLGG